MAAKFDYSLDYKNLDLRKNPELYRVGKGEQGVLMVEPYRTEIVRTGDSKRRKSPENLRRKFTKCFSNINDRKILSEWIWRGSFCRWELRGRVDTQIIRAAENIKRERGKLFPSRKLTRKKPKRENFFGKILSGKKRRGLSAS